jgi:SAM-dependent methyltransferase
MYEVIIKAQSDNALTVNYNTWVFDNICSYTGNAVMDVGVGAGNFLKYFLNKEVVLGIDVIDFFVDNLFKSYGSYKNMHFFNCDIQDDKVIQIALPYKIDTVICNNVLEHVQDDIKALNNINKILIHNGNLILILPAFQLLYSKWDKAVGHFRRYNYKTIKEKLTESNFSIQKSFYMNMLGFFAWFINGRILKNTPVSGSIIEKQAVFFDRHMVRCLRKIENIFTPPFGQSLIVVARPN